MRKLNRNLDISTFPQTFTGQQHTDNLLDLLRQRIEIKKQNETDYSFSSAKWKKAKPQLVSESQEKCAYCESYFTSVAYGDVEHFRPKSIYWWLAYSYVNYSASCQLCNQKYKKAIFKIPQDRIKEPKVRTNSSISSLKRISKTISPDPLDIDKTALNKYINDHSLERPFMIDPYIDDPKEYFAYLINDDAKEVEIVELNQAIKDIAQGTIELVGLNRKTLLTRRYHALEMYRILREFSESSSELRFKELSSIGLNFLLSDRSEFTGMFEYFHSRPLIPIP